MIKTLQSDFSFSLFGCLLIVAALPFGGTVLSWSLVAFALCWLVDRNWNEKAKRLRRNRWYFLFLVYYLFVCIGYWYSDDTSEASFKILQKVVLVLVPLFFATTLLVNHRRLIMNVAVVSIALCCLFLEIRAVYSFITENNGNVFFYDVYSLFLHASYFALLVSIALVVSLSNCLAPQLQRSQRLLWIAAALFFSVNVLQSSSRAGQLGLVIVWSITAIAALRELARLDLQTRLMLLAVPAFTLLLAFVFSSQTRLQTLKNVGTNTASSPAHAESSQVRLLIWEEAIKEIKEHPLLGVGTGDVVAALNKRYTERGMSDALEKNLNAHNQFLQTWLANGLVALVVLLSLLIWGFAVALQKKDFVALCFYTLTSFHFLFEAMLERREGLFMFAFFAGLFLSNAAAVNVSNASQEKSSSPIVN